MVMSVVDRVAEYCGAALSILYAAPGNLNGNGKLMVMSVVDRVAEYYGAALSRPYMGILINKVID